ncbi:hypothetical protein BT63DRAFT_397558 [Microthyrium microscopicum]|uniref:Peptidase A1 domain-containing protein n=1 Tax=Microthyrium microscopicum TaxID=703497 RepID=A0A6A6UQL8_9PEZI|nr:hypothetical protein BT63DRAFT_397558 [Microthyrium microscopicum]
MAESRPPPGQTSVGVRPVKGDVEYLITVKVGNHNLSLDLDTGSSDLWVFSTLQPQDQRSNRPVARVYDPSGSNAKTLDGHSWQIRYGDMSGASGKVYLDKVSIGDLTVDNQAVEAASTVSRTFTRDNMNDGLIGLAFGKLNTIKPTAQKTWFENVRPQLAQPVFTCTLKRRAVGTYDFGYIDKGKYKGDIAWGEIRGGKGFWDFETSAFQVGDGERVEFKVAAIADTGTSLWYMPKQVADAYWGKVEGAQFNQLQGGWVFPCSNTLPDLGLEVGGKMVVVPGANMNYQQISITTCFGGMQRNDRMPFSIFGDTFLKGLYVIFEAPENGPARIGFAQQSRQ